MFLGLLRTRHPRRTANGCFALNGADGHALPQELLEVLTAEVLGITSFLSESAFGAMQE